MNQYSGLASILLFRPSFSPKPKKSSFLQNQQLLWVIWYFCYWTNAIKNTSGTSNYFKDFDMIVSEQIPSKALPEPSITLIILIFSCWANAIKSTSRTRNHFEYFDLFVPETMPPKVDPESMFSTTFRNRWSSITNNITCKKTQRIWPNHLKFSIKRISKK